MKMILDVNNHGRTDKDDVLIYDGKIWSTISKRGFLRELIVKIDNLENNLKLANDRIAELELQIKRDHGEIE